MQQKGSTLNALATCATIFMRCASAHFRNYFVLTLYRNCIIEYIEQPTTG